MPELVFKGKEFVYNHHLSVPFRPLVAHADKGIGDARLDDNLIIHGDNLHALKALLPIYAGKVDCIFIDPPYNTGNEGWSYNDNVNSPMLREWLDGNPIAIDDGLRHDKWAAMMYPRLRLLHELLADAGSFWMTLDDNEVHHARGILDEIFGAHNFVATCIWQKVFSPKNSAQYFSEDHDYLIVYAKDKSIWRPNLLSRTEDMEARYSNPDDDPRGPWTSGDLSARNFYSEGTYPVTCPSGRVIPGPPPGSYWRVSERKFRELDSDDRIWWGEDGNNTPRLKRFLSEVKSGLVPQTIWTYHEVGHTQDAKKELIRIMGYEDSSDVFVTPKPVSLISKVLEIATGRDSIVLDSFSGSATTGHAVLKANAEDGGNRRFILVEMEDYADALTAERMRRVTSGYSFTGTLREELLRVNITWTRLRGASGLLEQIEALESLHGPSFDRITKSVTKGELVVTGETDVEEQAEGLGGSFTYCTLGDPIDMDSLLTGESLPSFEALASVLFHTATNTPLPTEPMETDALGQPGHGYLGEAAGVHVWLIYQPDLEFLKSTDAALTLAKARSIAETREGRHVVFAPARFVSQKMLNDADLPVEFAPLPFALYRVERE